MRLPCHNRHHSIITPNASLVSAWIRPVPSRTGGGGFGSHMVVPTWESDRDPIVANGSAITSSHGHVVSVIGSKHSTYREARSYTIDRQRDNLISGSVSKERMPARAVSAFVKEQ